MGTFEFVGVLGSARPSNFFSAFPGAPDSSLWYTSALANALSGKDLDKANPDIVIQVNANGGWNTRGDGLPTSREYDLQSVFLHEIAHGIGFLSNDSYDSFFSIASLDQPTPYDAYAQTLDGRRLADLPTPPANLPRHLHLHLSGLDSLLQLQMVVSSQSFTHLEIMNLAPPLAIWMRPPFQSLA